MSNKVLIVDYSQDDIVKPSGIKCGVLQLPDGVSVDGDLIKFGEDDVYVHCVITGTGGYYGIYKLDESDSHMYNQMIKLNS